MQPPCPGAPALCAQVMERGWQRAWCVRVAVWGEAGAVCEQSCGDGVGLLLRHGLESLGYAWLGSHPPGGLC